ncbi:hypothetical protein H4219_003141 [Mycoemilia scoparia]|uniref:RCK N-terminal domain-containing protein n=1 Tax=Mycoemilia scoparia TaxID=417184 RepID=A0A9W8DPP6_9FUNG|nr:hypothetical protein H4219_003141 [Mycoemilia scoparia]
MGSTTSPAYGGDYEDNGGGSSSSKNRKGKKVTMHPSSFIPKDNNDQSTTATSTAVKKNSGSGGKFKWAFKNRKNKKSKDNDSGGAGYGDSKRTTVGISAQSSVGFRAPRPLSLQRTASRTLRRASTLEFRKFGDVPEARVKNSVLKAGQTALSEHKFNPSENNGDQQYERRPSIRQVWSFYMETSSAGRRWDQFDAVLMIVFSLWYVYSTTFLETGDVSVPRKNLVVDGLLATILCIQFIPRYYLCADFKDYLVCPMSISTIITVLTSWMVLFNIFSQPEEYRYTFMSAGNWCLLYPVRFYRLQLSLMRTLRPVKNVYHLTPVARKALQALATVLTTVLAITVLTHIVVYTQGDSKELQDFGDAFFFTAVSSVTGLTSDIKPDRWYTRSIVIFIMFLGLFWLPPRMSEMLSLWENRIPWPKTFSPETSQQHVIIVGNNIPFYTTFEFLREFFCEDHGPATLNTVVVLMSETVPDKETAELLKDPSYVSRVKFVHGSPTSFKHLQRVKAHEADAIFLLNKSTDGTASTTTVGAAQKVDAAQVMLAMVIKKYLRAHGSKTKLIAQVSLPETTTHLKYLAKTAISTEKLRLGFLAQSVMVPGFTSFLQILTTSIPSNTAEQLAAACSDSNGLTWFKDYIQGTTHEIYNVKIPKALVGMTFQKAAQTIYHRFGATLFAIMCYLEPLDGDHGGGSSDHSNSSSSSSSSSDDDSSSSNSDSDSSGEHRRRRHRKRPTPTELRICPIGYKIQGCEIGFILSTESEVAWQISHMTNEAQQAIDIHDDDDENRHDQGGDDDDGFGLLDGNHESEPLLKKNNSSGGLFSSAPETKRTSTTETLVSAQKLSSYNATTTTAASMSSPTDNNTSGNANKTTSPQLQQQDAKSPIESASSETKPKAKSGLGLMGSNLMSAVEVVVSDLDKKEKKDAEKSKSEDKDKKSDDNGDDGSLTSVKDYGSELNVLYVNDEDKPADGGIIPKSKLHSGNVNNSGTFDKTSTQDFGNNTDNKDDEKSKKSKKKKSSSASSSDNEKNKDGKDNDDDDVMKVSKSNLVFFSDEEHGDMISPLSGRSNQSSKKTPSSAPNTGGTSGSASADFAQQSQETLSGGEKSTQANSSTNNSRSASASNIKTLGKDDTLVIDDNESSKSPKSAKPKFTADGLPVDLSNHIVICDTSDDFPPNLEFLVGCIRMGAPPPALVNAAGSSSTTTLGDTSNAEDAKSPSPSAFHDNLTAPPNTASSNAGEKSQPKEGSLTPNLLSQLLRFTRSNRSDFSGSSKEDEFNAKITELQKQLEKKNASDNENSEEEESKDEKKSIDSITKHMSNPHQPIVILSPGDYDISQIESLEAFGNIYLVGGTSLSRTDLLRAKIQSAMGAIILSDGNSKVEASQSTHFKIDLTASDTTSTATADSPALLSALNIELLTFGDPDFFLTVEMIHRENMQFVGDTETLKVNEVYAQAFLRSSFMSGHVFSPIMSSDTLVCQAYYNEYLVPIIEKLLYPCGHIDAFVQTSQLGVQQSIIDGDQFDGASDVVNSRVHLSKVPDRLHGRPYSSLFSYCCFQLDCVPLGLYRVAKHRGRYIWYCVPNPEPDCVLRKNDFVYVLSAKTPKLK